MVAEPSVSLRELGSGVVAMRIKIRGGAPLGEPGESGSFVRLTAGEGWSRPRGGAAYRYSPAPPKAGRGAVASRCLHDRVGFSRQVRRAHQARLVAQLGGDDV